VGEEVCFWTKEQQRVAWFFKGDGCSFGAASAFFTSRRRGTLGIGAWSTLTGVEEDENWMETRRNDEGARCWRWFGSEVQCAGRGRSGG